MSSYDSDSDSGSPSPQEHAVPSIINPGKPISASYTYHSPLPTAPGPYILGVDEAGRGPVLGPMVYGVAFCPEAWKDDLDNLGFADSKTLSHEKRTGLLNILSGRSEHMGWSVRVLCPQAISSGMLRIPPINLNKQAQEATVLLIREVLDRGITLSEVYVDALGPTKGHEAFLSNLFPGINFTVEAKADSKYKIVSAASIAAKVTRDACLEEWVWEEAESSSEDAVWSSRVGSGYPGDPKTKAWLEGALDKTFGFPGLVRFSWATVKVILERDGHPVKWVDEGQAHLIQAFEAGTGRDKNRCHIARDLGIKSVGSL
ncbi:ribonuclease H-like domain-containing protein [Thelephora terrestris]|uniref:Ribonuclease n=1 Tax=Thelephora terrestris TaxID=56493 RepID=A0A9P6LAX2_9AGAM|nr:ribonuclease H-like domain-containing protein [Thelephora terrestris]